MTGIVPQTVRQKLLRYVFEDMDMTDEEREFTHFIGHVISQQLRVDLNPSLKEVNYDLS